MSNKSYIATYKLLDRRAIKIVVHSAPSSLRDYVSRSAYTRDSGVSGSGSKSGILGARKETQHSHTMIVPPGTTNSSRKLALTGSSSRK